jgi:hypothetical protein
MELRRSINGLTHEVKHDGLAYYSLMLPVAHTSKRFWPQGKRPGRDSSAPEKFPRIRLEPGT